MPGNGLAILLEAGQVADHVDVLVAGNREIGLRPARGPRGRAARPRVRARGDAATPAAQMTVLAPIQLRADPDPVAGDLRDRLSQPDLDAERLQAAPVPWRRASRRRCPAPSGRPRPARRAPATCRCGGSRAPGSGGRPRPACPPARLRSAPRPRSRRSSTRGGASSSGSRSAISKAIRIRWRIRRASLERLQPGRQRRPFVVPEVGVGGPGGHDQVVVRHLAIGQDDASSPAGRSRWPRPAGPPRSSACGGSGGSGPRYPPG